MDEVPRVGLRERKKQETRSALSWAAIRLAVQRGLENVLVEDIAAEAGVSARTFNNYFSSKAEAIVSRHTDRVRQIAAQLREQPADQSLWEAITEAVVSRFGSPDQQDHTPDERWTSGIQLMMSEQVVQAELLRSTRGAEREVAVAIAERIGVGADELYPQLAAAAVGAALQVAMERWLRADPPEPFAPVLRKSLAQVVRLDEPIQ
jgi:AcrR family transcriptional regulator